MGCILTTASKYKKDALFFLKKKKKDFYLCIYFWPCWVFVAVRAFSLVGAHGGYSLVAVCGPLIAMPSAVAVTGSWAHGLLWFGSMGSVAPWHVGSSWIGHRPVSPALAGGFFTTEPPGKKSA